MRVSLIRFCFVSLILGLDTHYTQVQPFSKFSTYFTNQILYPPKDKNFLILVFLSYVVLTHANSYFLKRINGTGLISDLYQNKYWPQKRGWFGEGVR
jgi:hypothetical protein